jgi:hypothetical protein
MSRPLVPESELSEMRHKLAQKNEQIESQRSRIEELEFQAQMDRRDIQFLNELVRRIASHMIDINSDNQDLTELVDRLQEKMNELEDECEVAFELLRRNRELWTNFGPLFVLLLQATIDLIESWQDRGSKGEIFNTRAFKDSFMAVMLVTDRIVREMEEKLLFAPQTTIEGMIGRVRVPIIPGGLHVPGEAIGELHHSRSCPNMRTEGRRGNRLDCARYVVPIVPTPETTAGNPGEGLVAFAYQIRHVYSPLQRCLGSMFLSRRVASAANLRSVNPPLLRPANHHDISPRELTDALSSIILNLNAFESSYIPSPLAEA